jgi:hypothetical protein
VAHADIVLALVRYHSMYVHAVVLSRHSMTVNTLQAEQGADITYLVECAKATLPSGKVNVSVVPVCILHSPLEPHLTRTA